MDIVRYNWFGGFSFLDFIENILVNLVLYISNNLLLRFNKTKVKSVQLGKTLTFVKWSGVGGGGKL